jgi:RNA polymerase sigma-70 factor, ECF subfamily
LVGSDADLVRQCLDGENCAFDQLVRNYQQRVYALCYRTLGDPDQAADATQEAFVKAYHALGNFRQEASFHTWLFRIASNACFDMMRRSSRRRADSLDDLLTESREPAATQPSPEDAAVSSDTDRIVREAIMSVPMAHRMPLVMFYFGDMTTREIAATLQRPEGTVKSNLRYARELLRRKLEGVVIHT